MDTTAKAPSRLSMVLGYELFDGSPDHPLIKVRPDDVALDEVGDFIEYKMRVKAKPARHLGKVFALCLDEAAIIGFTVEVQCVEIVETIDAGAAAPTPIKRWLPVPAVNQHDESKLSWQSLTEEMVDRLDDVSHELLYETAKRLNFIRAAVWAERQIAAKKIQGPLLMKANQELSPLLSQMVGLTVSSLQQQGLLPAPSTKS